MTYLLDTNVCIALLRGEPRVRSRFADAASGGHEVTTATVVLYELSYGAAKSARPERNARAIEALMASISLLDFDDGDAVAAGTVRATLENAGTPIGPYDILIAGTALNRTLTVVTANTREFSRVDGLSWEDWTLPEDPSKT